MDSKEIRKFIERQFKEVIESHPNDYHKLMEKVLQARKSILDFLPEGAPKEAVGHDSVNHPSHYTSHPSGIECIEIARHYCFSIGNAIKYLWRAGLKREKGLEDKQKEMEDLKKAVWYINDRINQLSNE